jgi:hypothetical protein
MPSKKGNLLLSTSTQQLEKIFKNLPKPLQWRYFYLRDLPILMDISEEVRKLAIQNSLSRAQIMALEALKSASSEEYQKVTAHSKGSSSSVVGPGRKKAAQIDLKDLSGREIEGIAEKAAKEESLTELKSQWDNTPEAYKSGSL